MSACPASLPDAGAIRELLAVTHCNVAEFSESGYRALSANAMFPTAVTILLTIYVAVLGYRLLLGYGAPALSDLPVIGLKIGTILALTLNWTVFQTLVLDVATKAPSEIASAIVGAQGSPVDRLQDAYDELHLDQAAFAKLAQTDTLAARNDDADASLGLSHAATGLFAATAGLLSFAAVVSGVLIAIGPVFIALFLFETAGGLFAGWLRALAAAAFIPMLCWITTVIMLTTLEPRLIELSQQRSMQSMDAGYATVTIWIVYVFVAAQFALVAASAIVAGGFRLPAMRRHAASENAPRLQQPVTNYGDHSRVDQLVQAVHRSSSSRESVIDRAMLGASGGDVVLVNASTSGTTRPTRLGENYRRKASRAMTNPGGAFRR
jgi:type IV secretion system protein VirB6